MAKFQIGNRVRVKPRGDAGEIIGLTKYHQWGCKFSVPTRDVRMIVLTDAGRRVVASVGRLELITGEQV